MKKRFLPLFLCMVMFVSLLPIASLEASAVTNEYSNARQLKLGRSTNISVSESNGWEDFLYFTPDSSGWYTFTGTSSRIWLYDIVTSEEERPDSFNGDVSMLTGNGADVYLDAGKTYYLAFYFIGGAYNSSETKSAISVKKAETFDTISEGQRINLSFDAHLYWVDGGGGVPFKYLQFIPNNTAEYTINCSFSSWMGRGVGIVDSHGKSVSIEESGDWHPSKAEYKCALFAGKTYYIGIMVENWDSDTYCEISIVGKPSQSEGSQEQITDCTEHKYTSAGGNICTVCGYEFEPELIEYNKTLYAAIENAAVRSQPYAKAGALVDKLAKGEAVRVTHYFYNSLGSKWYKTENGNYIYSERLTSVSSGAKTYTLSFNANGSGVSNLPSSVNIREGVRYAIPGKASGIPSRTGYTFLGYSTNKNATSAEYQPGNSVMLTKDMILYAVWKKCETDLANVPGVAQNQNGDQGTCTSAATAVILARRLLVDGKCDETFTYRDVRRSCNNSFKLVNMTNGVTTYSLKKETLSSVRGNLNLIVNTTIPYLLDEHPEGIVVYFDYINAKGTERPHAIVLSDYEVLSNGKYQLYAYDSGSSTRLGRMPIEETWLWTDALGFTNSNTYEDLFAHLNDDYNFGATGVCVWYVDKEV